jgi:hypothetical protein
MPDPVKNLQNSLGDFLNTTPLAAPAQWMGQMGQKIMQSPLAQELMKRFYDPTAMQSQINLRRDVVPGPMPPVPVYGPTRTTNMPPVTYIKGGHITHQ